MAFDPVSLFGSGEQGVIYDVQTLSSMFQDSAGTVPAVVDSPVGRINDLSGNGNHCVQTTNGMRPALRYAAERGYYLEADAVDDFMVTAFAINAPVTRISLVEQRTQANTDVLIGGGTGFTGHLEQNASPNQLNIRAGNRAPSTTRLDQGMPGLVTEVYNGAASQIGINQDALTTGDAGSSALTGISLFATYNGLGPSDSRFYGTGMIDRALTAAEVEDVQWWLTQRWARVLVVDGDSNTQAASTAATGYAKQYLTHASPPVFLDNVAYSGTGLDSAVPNDLITAARVADIDARIPSNKRGRQYVYFAWWSNNAPTGANYLTPVPARTQAQYAAAVAAFLAERKAAGWDKVGIGTLCERSDVGQDNRETRATYNSIISAPGWIEANGIDFLVDFAADPVIGAVGASLDLTLVSDGVHFTTLGHTYLEAVFRAAVNALPLPSTTATPAQSVYLKWRT